MIYLDLSLKVGAALRGSESSTNDHSSVTHV